MHEVSLAKATYDTINSICLKFNKSINQIKEINLSIGEIQYLDLDIFFNFLKDYLNNEDINIKWNIKKAKLKCNICFNEWLYSENLNNLKEEEKEAIHFIPETVHLYIRCPKCNSNDFSIIDGRGVFVESITYNEE
ncbi:MAG: hydrogenase nickel incorporation protein HypA [bacterium]